MLDRLKKKFEEIGDKIEGEEPIKKPKGMATIVEMEEPINQFPDHETSE